MVRINSTSTVDLIILPLLPLLPLFLPPPPPTPSLSDLPPDDPAALESATTGTWAGRLPASLLPSLPAHSHAHASPTRSPGKRPAEESPSKVKTVSLLLGMGIGQY